MFAIEHLCSSSSSGQICKGEKVKAPGASVSQKKLGRCRGLGRASRFAARVGDATRASCHSAVQQNGSGCKNHSETQRGRATHVGAIVRALHLRVADLLALAVLEVVVRIGAGGQGQQDSERCGASRAHARVRFAAGTAALSLRLEASRRQLR